MSSDHGTKLVPAGDIVDVLVGVSNGSPEAVNVTAAMGSINSPQNFDMHLQNFSLYQYHMLVPPEQTASLLYQIRSDPNLYARDWQFALTLFYHSAGVRHSDTFFNESVTVVEADKTIDFEILFMYLILLGLLAVGGFFGYQAVKNTPMMKKVAGGAKKPVKKSAAGGGGDDPDQWLAGTQYAKDMKKRNQKQKKKEDQ
eukprot:TRINITY_DN19333_c0_g1_i3.p1 TRINITY_DN19333_c0_g1~~TRINITY_DN19333_c0_g1_i3.p1  ORF type:complete len:199 (-),score=43.97 TRINITY_DN19333_c0_g1_i3:241-837(-)